MTNYTIIIPERYHFKEGPVCITEKGTKIIIDPDCKIEKMVDILKEE